MYAVHVLYLVSNIAMPNPLLFNCWTLSHRVLGDHTQSTAPCDLVPPPFCQAHILRYKLQQSPMLASIASHLIKKIKAWAEGVFQCLTSMPVGLSPFQIVLDELMNVWQRHFSCLSPRLYVTWRLQPSLTSVLTPLSPGVRLL